MNKKLIVLILFILLSVIGCATIPKNGETVFVEVTHIFNKEEYRNAIENKKSFKGFLSERKLSMIEAAINEGVTLENVINQRLVACQCSCGGQCYTSYPLLLPEDIKITLYDLIEIKTGINKWQRDSQRYNYTLSKYQRHINVPFKYWVRIEGNHNHLPSCYPAKWKK